jgi:hypothetical protein
MRSYCDQQYDCIRTEHYCIIVLSRVTFIIYCTVIFTSPAATNYKNEEYLALGATQRAILVFASVSMKKSMMFFTRPFKRSLMSQSLHNYYLYTRHVFSQEGFLSYFLPERLTSGYFASCFSGWIPLAKLRLSLGIFERLLFCTVRSHTTPRSSHRTGSLRPRKWAFTEVIETSV